jgi:biotin carboxyl carrier protein
MTLQFAYNGETITLDVQPDGDGWRVRLPDGSEKRMEASRSEDGVLTVRTEGRTFQAAAARIGQAVHVSYDGQAYLFEPPAARRTGSGNHATGTLEAPMPGVVADVLVAVGDKVEAYQPLAVVEAMKVMATVEAPFAGTVVRVGVEKGQRVAQGDLIVEVQAAGDSDGKQLA